MGTTLTNGIYLPNEGEKNCYAGLKTNWEILDQKVADVTALQQAVAGALHREIVASLPTTDIDPNTIYMILSGTSATENVYDEFMYVNNAWELIGTSATDLTNYYTKGDVDGLLLLKANASDLTSHTGDTTIHVTASDKSKWDTVALIKQLRLVNAQVGSATTIAFANIDDTNGIKVGDKCMDLDAKMFEITAVDTTNQTVTVGSALIDLALDANVVHTSGEESVIGSKRFGVVQSFTGFPSIRLYSSNDDVTVVPSYVQQQDIRYTDKNNNIIAYFIFQHRPDANEPFRTCWRQVKLDGTDGYYSVNFNNLGEFYPENNNAIKLGTSTKRWASIYATNYYYGNDNVEFSTKFVTTDTSQTISGNKTFSGNVSIYNSDTSTDARYLILQNQKVKRGSTTETGTQFITFHDKDNGTLASYETTVLVSGNTEAYINVSNLDANSQRVVGGVKVIKTPTETWFIPDSNNSVSSGLSNYKWKDVQTNLINGLTPSSLSLPSNTGYVDISGYFTNTGDGQTNSYTASANGWIYLNVTAKTLIMQIKNSNNSTIYADMCVRSSDGTIYMTIPISSGNKLLTQWFTSSSVTVTTARFIPCQGNV